MLAEAADSPLCDGFVKNIRNFFQRSISSYFAYLA